MGLTPKLNNTYVISELNSTGIASRGGIGLGIAELKYGTGIKI